MRISEVARAAGVGVETVRFYEKKGLITQPPTPIDGGIRQYNREVVYRIKFVRQAQRIGFSLREIEELLSLHADPKADCADVRTRAIEKREEVQGKLEQLRRMRNALDVLIASCPGGGDVKVCTILDAMTQDNDIADAAASLRPHTTKKEDQMKTTVLTIKGMHCDGCAHTVESLLGRVPGVRKAEASFDEQQARILHDQNTASETDLIAAIVQGGFEAMVDRQ